MPSFKPSDLQDRLSEMHSLRHDVRSRLHLAGVEELKEWQKVEPDTEEIDREIDRGMLHEGRLEKLETVIARLTKLRDAIHQGIPDSRSMPAAEAVLGGKIPKVR